MNSKELFIVSTLKTKQATASKGKEKKRKKKELTPPRPAQNIYSP